MPKNIFGWNQNDHKILKILSNILLFDVDYYS